MTEYELWADEYKQTADNTREKIRSLEESRRHCRDPSKLRSIDGRLLILYEIYSDCMECYNELMKKAEKIKEDGYGSE